jgi:hypothetical protein
VQPPARTAIAAHERCRIYTVGLVCKQYEGARTADCCAACICCWLVKHCMLEGCSGMPSPLFVWASSKHATTVQDCM